MSEGPAETLTETRNAQPAILAHSTAVALELSARGVEPSLVAGHSLGEFSAAVAAGALEPLTALTLVRRRGELMWDAGTQRPGAMSAVMGLAADVVERICREISEHAGVVVLANHNSPAQVAISGEQAAVAAAGEALKEAGARRVIPLPVSGAFHSPLLAEAAAAFAGELDRCTFEDPGVPLIANVSAEPVRSAAALIDGMRRQLTAPVLWQDSVARIVDGLGAGPRVVLEVGPGQVLANLARRTYPDVTFLSVGTVADLDALAERLTAAADAAPPVKEAENG
jgi:[acyl-carrier-protein] S-malonyltransferase